jgi:hypothetical protein
MYARAGSTEGSVSVLKCPNERWYQNSSATRWECYQRKSSTLALCRFWWLSRTARSAFPSQALSRCHSSSEWASRYSCSQRGHFTVCWLTSVPLIVGMPLAILISVTAMTAFYSLRSARTKIASRRFRRWTREGRDSISRKHIGARVQS